MEKEELELLIKRSKTYLKRWTKKITEEEKGMLDKVIKTFNWDIMSHFFLSQCEYEGLLDTVKEVLLGNDDHKKFSKDEVVRLNKVFSHAIIIAHSQVSLSPEGRRLYAFIEVQLSASLEEMHNDALEEFPAMSSETVRNTIINVMRTMVKLEENKD